MSMNTPDITLLKEAIWKRPQHAARTLSAHTGWRASISLLWACSVLLAGCSKPIADARFEVVDTGVWAIDSAKPIWLDNHRILFNSTETLTPGPGNRVVVWDINTKKITKTTLTEHLLCSRAGSVTYAITDKVSKKTTYYRGPIENIKEHPAPGPDMWIDPFFACDWVSRPKIADQDKLPLTGILIGENFTQIIAQWSEEPYEHQKRLKDRKPGIASGPKGKTLYHQNKADPGREIPFAAGIAYSEYLDVYLISRDYYSTKWSETRSFWLLQRSGELKEISYPETMLEGRNDVFPVKGGYLVYYSSGPLTETDNGDRGIYFLTDNGILQRLLIGEMAPQIESISPNGCMAAFVHADTIKQNLSETRPYRTVKYINFCQGGVTP